MGGSKQQDGPGVGKVNLGRTIRAALRPLPSFPKVSGDVLVFAAAPDPIVPERLLRQGTIVTANASQVYLERLGVQKPHITCMRADMDDDKPTSPLKLKALEGRSTGLLVLFATHRDKTCSTQLSLLDRVGYRHDDVLVLTRLGAGMMFNKVYAPGSHLQRDYMMSMGLRAITLALAAGARRVVVSGLSFRRDGYAAIDLDDYKRLHAREDLDIFAEIRRLGHPVLASDAALAEDAGIALWDDRQAP